MNRGLQRPDGDKTREVEMRQRYNIPRVSGLYRPFPDQTTSSYMQTLTLNDVNSEQYRQQIINQCEPVPFIELIDPQTGYKGRESPDRTSR